MYRDGVTKSSINCFKSCHEQFRLEYVEGWGGGSPSIYLAWGNAMAWFLARLRDKRIKTPADVTMYDRVWHAEDGADASKRERELHEKVLAFAAAIWPTYMKQYENERNKNWIAVEHPFDIEMEINRVDGSKFTTRFRGVIDGVYRDDDGKLVLNEDKTKSRIDEDAIEGMLQVDFQTNAYAFACFEAFGEIPKEIRYNVIRTPSTDLIQKDQGSYAMMSTRLMATIDKDPDHYFTEFFLPAKLATIEAFMANEFTASLQAMDVWAQGGPHVFNDNALFMYSRKADMYGPIVEGDFTGCHRKPFSKRKLR